MKERWGLWREEVLTVLLGIVQGSVRGDMSKPSLQTLILTPVSMMASFFFYVFWGIISNCKNNLKQRHDFCSQVPIVYLLPPLFCLCVCAHIYTGTSSEQGTPPYISPLITSGDFLRTKSQDSCQHLEI